jgi:hypothetical protein
MRNMGSTTWPAASDYRLGSQNPQDNTTWGTHRVQLSSAVAPGQYGVFNFTVTAPATPGSYPFQWRMVRELVEWFGDYSPTVQVGVTAAPQSARFVTQSVPTAMTTNATYSVWVSMTNTGETTWYPGSHFLASENLQDNTRWRLNRVALPHSVGPGGQVTFTFNVTAPATAGSYNFQWRMHQEGVGRFGDFTPNIVVGVTAPPSTCTTSTCSQQCIADGYDTGSCYSGVCRCRYIITCATTGTTSLSARNGETTQALQAPQCP